MEGQAKLFYAYPRLHRRISDHNPKTRKETMDQGVRYQVFKLCLEHMRVGLEGLAEIDTWPNGKGAAVSSDTFNKETGEVEFDILSLYTYAGLIVEATVPDNDVQGVMLAAYGFGLPTLAVHSWSVKPSIPEELLKGRGEADMMQFVYRDPTDFARHEARSEAERTPPGQQDHLTMLRPLHLFPPQTFRQFIESMLKRSATSVQTG